MEKLIRQQININKIIFRSMPDRGNADDVLTDETVEGKIINQQGFVLCIYRFAESF